jgi:hypothetical protein
MPPATACSIVSIAMPPSIKAITILTASTEPYVNRPRSSGRKSPICSSQWTRPSSQPASSATSEAE